MKPLIFSLFLGLSLISTTSFAEETVFKAESFLSQVTPGKILKTESSNTTTDGASTQTTTYEDGTTMTIMPNKPNPPIITWRLSNGAIYRTKAGTADQFVKVQDATKQNTQTQQSPAIKTPTNVSALDSIVNPTSNGLNFGDQPLSRILNQLFFVGLVIAVILAIVMIIRGGIEYMTIDAISSKESGKNRVKAALGGLTLAFSAILILNTINPSITDLKIMFPTLRQIGPIGVGGVTSGVRIDPITGTVTAKMESGELRDYTLQKIKEMGFSQLSPSDKANFFPNGGTDEEWLGLVSAMMKYESGFDPNQTYTENFTDNSGNRVISTGLLQLSQESAKGYGFNVTTEQLKDPKTNVDVGLAILKKWVAEDGCISCGDNKGGARYWSVLRPSGKLNDVRNEMVK